MWMENWARVAGGAMWGVPAPLGVAAGCGGVIRCLHVFKTWCHAASVMKVEMAMCDGWALSFAYSTYLALEAAFYPPRATGSLEEATQVSSGSYEALRSLAKRC